MQPFKRFPLSLNYLAMMLSPLIEEPLYNWNETEVLLGHSFSLFKPLVQNVLLESEYIYKNESTH